MIRGRYTCFLHPKEDMSEHDMSDLCPECNRPYSFPLESVPSAIGEFQIEAANRAWLLCGHLPGQIWDLGREGRPKGDSTGNI